MLYQPKSTYKTNTYTNYDDDTLCIYIIYVRAFLMKATYMNDIKCCFFQFEW